MEAMNEAVCIVCANQAAWMSPSAAAELLRQFCNPVNERYASPMSFDGWSCATDGHIAVRVPYIPGVDRPVSNEGIKTLPWEPTVPGEWVDLPDYQLPAEKICGVCHGTGRMSFCPECDGDGELEFSTTHNRYYVECNTCDGHGEVSGNAKTCEACSGTGTGYKDSVCRVEFGDGVVDGFNLEKIRLLPGIELFSRQAKMMFWFRFNGGHGVFMGMNRP